MYRVIKTYGNDRGLSCAFRQWKADSHCNLIHGYSLGFKITFEADTLDSRNWVIDFGDFSKLKNFLEDTFDHTTAVAEDDPHIYTFRKLSHDGLIRLVMMESVGCEMFAKYVYDYCVREYNDDRVRVHSVECFEHGANSAIFGNF
jgi:6-pyruvoyltetrahydropterin/6-carboxytetrahydropterin synthase